MNFPIPDRVKILANIVNHCYHHCCKIQTIRFAKIMTSIMLLSYRNSSRLVFIAENISFIPVHSIMVGLVPGREKNVTQQCPEEIKISINQRDSPR